MACVTAASLSANVVSLLSRLTDSKEDFQVNGGSLAGFVLFCVVVFSLWVCRRAIGRLTTETVVEKKTKKQLCTETLNVTAGMLFILLSFFEKRWFMYDGNHFLGRNASRDEHAGK